MGILSPNTTRVHQIYFQIKCQQSLRINVYLHVQFHIIYVNVFLFKSNRNVHVVLSQRLFPCIKKRNHTGHWKTVRKRYLGDWRHGKYPPRRKDGQSFLLHILSDKVSQQWKWIHFSYERPHCESRTLLQMAALAPLSAQIKQSFWMS